MSPDGILSDVFIVACVFTKTPIDCACLVGAWWNVIPRTSAILCIIFETKTELLSVIITVGRYACLVLILMITFAVLTAVGPDNVYSNACLKKTSIAVMMFSQPALSESSGSRSTCMTSSGPKSQSVLLMS